MGMHIERRTYRLADLCELRAGSGFKLDLQGKQVGDYPFIKVSDMNLSGNETRIRVANNWISEADREKLKAKPFPLGTTVFAKIGEALKQNRLRLITRNTIIDNNMMGAIPDHSRVDPEYFYYALSKFDFGAISGGTALPYLTVSALNELRLELPPQREQRAIAHILGTFDEKIELNRSMNETLEAMARAVFQSWFVDFDPVRAKASGESADSICQRLGLTPELLALFPDSFEDSELGEIPKGWTVGTLGDLASNPKRGIQPDKISPTTPYIALEHMPRRSIALSDWGYGDGLESNKFEFQKGEILFGKLRPYFHKVGVAPLAGVCSTDILVVAPKSDVWFGVVLGHVSSNAFIEHTNAGSTGTKMPRTSWKEMSAYRIPLPTSAIAEQFNTQVSEALGRMNSAILESKSLGEMRDTLLPKLLSGELPVATAAAEKAV